MGHGGVVSVGGWTDEHRQGHAEADQPADVGPQPLGDVGRERGGQVAALDAGGDRVEARRAQLVADLTPQLLVLGALRLRTRVVVRDADETGPANPVLDLGPETRCTCAVASSGRITRCGRTRRGWSRSSRR